MGFSRLWSRISGLVHLVSGVGLEFQPNPRIGFRFEVWSSGFGTGFRVWSTGFGIRILNSALDFGIRALGLALGLPANHAGAGRVLRA